MAVIQPRMNMSSCAWLTGDGPELVWFRAIAYLRLGSAGLVFWDWY